MSKYAITELFESIQGEGARVGTLTTFLRFACCNLWNGRADGRETGRGACARWCDTEFVHGHHLLTSEEIVAQLDALSSCKRVVVTGGEPLMQFDHELAGRLLDAGYFIAVETNGTVAPVRVVQEAGVFAETALDEVDWITVSPKLGQDGNPLPPLDLGVSTDELKVVVPGVVGMQEGWLLEQIDELVEFYHPAAVFLQPQARYTDYGQWAVQRCLELLRQRQHHRVPWRLSAQVHKYLAVR